MGGSSRSFAVGLISVFIGLTALPMFRHLTGPWDDTLKIVVVCAIGVLAVPACVAIWQKRPWALRFYVLWAVVFVAGGAAMDWRVEPVLWKVIVGAVVMALLSLGFGLVLKHELFKSDERSP